MKESINRFNAGMHRDNSPEEQPEGTTRFNLNSVGESRDGEQSFIANEEGNYGCHDFGAGFTPIGQVYIGNDQTVIFLVNADETVSRIGIANRDCTFTLLVDADFGFRLENTIDAVFRLRRGCERIIYWVDPKPRYFNLDKAQSFKDSLGAWNIPSFNLFTKYTDVPTFKNIEIEENGEILPGSYNAAIQYLDTNFNPTEWITSSDTIQIYNDNTSKSYSAIRGSTAVKTDYQK